MTTMDITITLPRDAAHALALAVDHIAEEARTHVRNGDSTPHIVQRMIRYTITYGRINAAIAGDYDSPTMVDIPMVFVDWTHARTVLGALREWRDQAGDRWLTPMPETEAIDAAIEAIENAAAHLSTRTGLGPDTTISRGGSFR